MAKKLWGFDIVGVKLHKLHPDTYQLFPQFLEVLYWKSEHIWAAPLHKNDDTQTAHRVFGILKITCRIAANA